MKKISILLVEDEPIIAADLEDRLDEMGFEVVYSCTSGEEALIAFREHLPDLVLLDIQLEGEWDGIQTAGKLLEIRSVPIIFLTSNADEATFNRAKSTQPAAYLSKPFRGKDLKHAIELAITKKLALTEKPSKTEKEESDAHLYSDRLFIRVKDRMVRIYLQEILWLEADDYYCKMATREREYLVTQTLKQMFESLSGIPDFMRIHRSYIVNIRHIEEIGDQFVVVHKKQIPINKAAKDELLTLLHKI